MRLFSIPRLSQQKGKLLLFSALSIVPLASCEKKETPAGEAPTSVAEVIQAATDAAPAKGWVAEAPKLGFSAHVPLKSEAYFATVNWPKHLAALKATHYWKQVGSFLEDTVPAPTAGEEVNPLDIDFLEQEFFYVGGQGTGDLLCLLFQLQGLQKEGSIYSALSGIGSTPDPDAAAFQFLNSPHVIKKFQKLIQDFKVPALFAGYQPEDAAKEVEKQLDKNFRKVAEKKQGTLGELTNAQGVKFTTLETTVGSQLTPEKIEKALESLSSDDTQKALLKEALEQLAAIPVRVAIGHHQGFVLIGTYREASDLNFANSPSESILAHEKFQKLEGHLGKNLLSINYASKELIEGMKDAQSMNSLLDGFNAALQENDSTKQVISKIQGEVDALVASYQKLYDYGSTDAAGVIFWDNGLHVDIVGGYDYRQVDLAKPLQYSHLLKNEALVFGYNGHSTPEYTQNVTEYMENLTSVAYKVSKELAQAGLFGEDATQQVAMAEMMVIPTWSKIYGNLKDLFLKGTDTESFYGVDLQGPNELGGEPDKKGFPRFYSVHAVKDDAIIRSSWNEVNNTVTGLLGMFGMAGGPGQEGGMLPAATSQPVSGDLVQWHYPSPLISGDLSPNAVISSKHLVLSTSMAAGKEVAEALEAPTTRQITQGAHLLLNFKHLKSLVDTSSKLKPATDEAAKEEAAETEANLQNFDRFIAPLETLNFKALKDGDADVRTLIDWTIKDTKSFD